MISYKPLVVAPLLSHIWRALESRFFVAHLIPVGFSPDALLENVDDGCLGNSMKFCKLLLGPLPSAVQLPDCTGLLKTELSVIGAAMFGFSQKLNMRRVDATLYLAQVMKFVLRPRWDFTVYGLVNPTVSISGAPFVAREHGVARGGNMSVPNPARSSMAAIYDCVISRWYIIHDSLQSRLSVPEVLAHRPAFSLTELYHTGDDL